MGSEASHQASGSNARGRARALLGLVGAAVALGALAAAPAQAALSATAAIDSNVNYLGDPGRNFTITVTNNGTVPVTSVQILDQASGIMPTIGCPTPPTGWTATFTSSQCTFTTVAGPNALAPAQSKPFVIRVSTTAGPYDQNGSFGVFLNGTTYATPYTLPVKIHAWEITDVIVVPSAATVNGPCPAPNKQAPKGVTVKLVICGINHTTATATPSGATLAGTLIVAPPGTYTSGPVTTGATPRVLGNWSNVSLNQSAGPQTVIASVNSAYYATSPATTFGGFTTNRPPVAVDDGPYTLNEDGSFILADPGIKANDSDPDGDAITVKLPVDVLPLHGTLAQNAAGGFTYTPFANYNGTDSYKYKVTDGQSDSNQATVSFTINPIQDVPTSIGLSPSSVAENQPVNTLVGTFSTTDVDLPGDSHTYTLVTGTGDTGNASFTISGNQLLTNSVFNFEGQASYSIRVRSTDAGSNFFEGPLTVTITNVNEVPSNLTLSNATVNENQPIGTLIGTLTATDPDVGDTFTWTFASGAGDADNGSFQIVGSQLKTNAVFDFETKSSYAIRVRGTDAGGLFREETGTITVTNGNEQPTNLALTPSLVAENQPVGTAVGTLSSTDPDAGDTFTYTLVDTGTFPDNASFQISGNQVQTNAVFDVEFDNIYSIRVRSTDAGGLFLEKTFTVTITGVNEQPTDLALSPSAVNENQPVNTSVGTLSSTDPDAGDTFTYTLVDTGSFPDNAGFQISGNALRTNAVFDFETKSSYSIRVRTTDTGGLFFEKTLSVGINDINDAPVANPDTYTVVGGSLTVAAPGVLGNDTDQDAGATRTAVLNSQPLHQTATFVLNANGSFTYTPNVSTGSDSFTYHAVDNNGASSAVVTVTLNLNQPPVAVNDTATTNEDTGVIIDLSTNDTDPDNLNSALTAVNIVQGTGGSAVLQAGNRTVLFTPNADFNGATSFTYQAFDGSSVSTNTATVSINVTAVNDDPVNHMPASPSTNEDTPLTLSGAGAISISDVDAGGAPVQVSLTAAWGTMTLDGTSGLSFTGGDGSADASMIFTGTIANINAALDGMTFTPSLNYSGAAAAGIQITTNDQGNTGTGGPKSDTDSLVITVNAVNDAPVNTMPATASGNEDTAFAISGISVADVDIASSPLKVTLSATNGTVTMSAPAGGTISGSGTSTIIATGTLANVNTALGTVSFTGAINVNGAATLQLVSDDQGATGSGGPLTDTDTTSITINAVNDAPVVTTSSGTVNFTEDGPVVVVDNLITVADVDSTTFNQATISITGNFTAAEDALSFSCGTLCGGYSPGTGVATITGSGSLADYQAILRTVNYSNSSNNPNTATRTISFTLRDTDGPSTSAPATRNVTVTAVNDAPVLAAIEAGTLGYTENDPATAITSTMTLTDIDSANMTGATAQITGNYQNGQDVLSFTNTATITAAAFDTTTGKITLSGTDTKANYQAALRAIKYANTSDNPSTLVRTVTFQANDGGAVNNLSNTQTRTITIAPSDDNPALAGIELTNLAYTEGDPATAISSTITATDVDSPNLTGATIDIGAGFSSSDELVFTDTANITGVYTTGTGTMTLTGTDTVANYQAALRAVKYRHNGDNPTASGATRNVTFFVSNALPSNTVLRVIAITAVNDPPANTVPSSPQTGTEDTAKAVPMSVADPDIGTNPLKVTLTAANGTMTMTTLTGLGFTSGDGTADASMIFTGTTTQVNAALATLSYLGNANYNVAFAGDSTVTLLSDDQGATGTGGALTDSDTVQIDLAAVNDAPVAVVKSVTVQANMALNDVPNMLVGVTDPDSGDPGYVAGHTLNTVTANTCTGANITDIQAAAGSFDLNPPAGSTAACALQYTVIDNGSPVGPAATSAAANINVTISGPVIWFVDFAAGSDTNTGRLNDPFKTIAAADAVDNTVVAFGHRIFLYTSSNYADPITLNANEWLIGQGIPGSSFDSVMGITPPANTVARPSINGTRPEIDNKVTFGGTNGAVRGLNLTPASGTEGIATVAGGADGLSVGSVSVATTNAAAINFVNSSGATSFTEVDATGGTSGIIWNNSSAEAGGLTITGTGTADCTSVATCTGGAIQSMTGPGVLLNNMTGGATFTNFLVQNGTDDGIRATSVTGFTLINGMVHNNGDAAGERGVELTNVTGSGGLSGTTLSQNSEDNLEVNNNTGSLTMSITSSIIKDTVLKADGNDGILVTGDGPANVTINITGNNQFSNPDGDHIQVGPAASATGTWTANITGNTFTNTSGPTGSLGSGITLGADGTAHGKFTVSNNTITNAVVASIDVGIGASTTATVDVTISGNTIGLAGAGNLNSGGAEGIDIDVNQAGTLNALVKNNTIRNWGNPAGAIRAIARDGSGTMNVTMTGNLITDPNALNGLDGIAVYNGNGTAGESEKVCADLGGSGIADGTSPTGTDKNNISSQEANGGGDIYLEQRIGTTTRLRGYTGAFNSSADLQTYLFARNVMDSFFNGTIVGTGYQNTSPAGSACPLPS